MKPPLGDDAPPMKKRMYDRFRGAITEHLGTPDLTGISDIVRAELALEQANSVARLFPLFALTGISTLAVLAIGLRHESLSLTVDVVGVGIALIYGLVLQRIRSWHVLADRRAEAAPFLEGLTVMVAILGSAWACLSTLVMLAADHAGRDLLFGIDIGVTSSSVLLMPRRVALACWIPSTVGGLIAAWDLSAAFGPLIALAYGSYSALIGSAMLFTNRSLVLRTVARMQVQEQGEVIGMLLREFEENASDWLWQTDRLLRLTHVSPRLAKVTGRQASELQGLSLRTLLLELAPARPSEEDANAEILSCLDTRSPIYNRELRVRIGGHERFWNMICEPVTDADGRFVGYRGIGSDITNAKRSQREIAFLARHDVLTGLPNRRLFGELLGAACQDAARRPFALLCVDLDRFKSINDRFGHAGGDALLVVVAQRLRDSVRGDDVVVRLGGDEFAIILRTGDRREIELVTRRVLEALALPLHVQGSRVEIAASVGAACAPEDASGATTLLHYADLALYAAKAAGRATARFFVREMADALADRQRIETDLRRALDAGELFLEYQPLICLRDGSLRGAEALVRWMHPTRGHLGPNRFIEVAEQTGLVVEIGAWVLRTAAEAAARWPVPLSIAVNVSAVQLRDRNLTRRVEEALAATGLPAERLELELTETALISSGPIIETTLHALSERGVRIALDDFGLGYSSLSHVCSFPFNKIKIAQAFVGDIENRIDKQAVVRAIAGLGTMLGITTTAEGVETERQLDMLRDIGCTQAQGYLLGRPMSEDAFRRLLVERSVVDGGKVRQVIPGALPLDPIGAGGPKPLH